MSTGQMIMSTLSSAIFVVLNILYWMRAMGRWQEAFRRGVERRYRVTLTSGYKGQWKVVEPITFHKSLGIEMLQLAYFMGVFFAWALGLGLGALFFWLLGKLGLPQIIGK